MTIGVLGGAALAAGLFAVLAPAPGPGAPALPVSLAALVLAGAALWVRLGEQRQRAETREVLQAAERARLIREFVAARELERRRLWERLHDLILQTSAGNLLRLDTVRVLLEEGRGTEAEALLREAVRTERQVFDDLRRLMGEMNVEPAAGRVASADPLAVVVSIPETVDSEARGAER